MGESPELQRVLGCADHVEGPSASGEYSARCPCHDDKTASLSIRQKVGSDGVERIMVHCHAGCQTDDILKAWGLSYRDLVVGAEDRGPAKPRRQQPKPRPKLQCFPNFVSRATPARTCSSSSICLRKPSSR